MSRFPLIFILVLLTLNTAIAGPAAPDAIEITQPDGTSFQARMQGDERKHWVETVPDGRTILRNRETGYWEYAERQPDGTLKGSGIKVDPSGQGAPAAPPGENKPPQ